MANCGQILLIKLCDKHFAMSFKFMFLKDNSTLRPFFPFISHSLHELEAIKCANSFICEVVASNNYGEKGQMVSVIRLLPLEVFSPFDKRHNEIFPCALEVRTSVLGMFSYPPNFTQKAQCLFHSIPCLSKACQ